MGNLYAHHWPFKQPVTSRGVRRSAFHDRLAGLGGLLRGGGRLGAGQLVRSGKGKEAVYDYSWGRQNWFDYSAAEHMAVREGVGVYDLSSMAVFLLQGPDSERVLQRICANNVAVDLGPGGLHPASQ